jgi:hypothetical protein
VCSLAVLSVAVVSLSSNSSRGISAMKRRRYQVGGQPGPALREDHPVLDWYESTRAWLLARPLICLSDRTLLHNDLLSSF